MDTKRILIIEDDIEIGNLEQEVLEQHSYALLHDLNPTGQAAQLSAMQIFHSIRWIVCDLGWMLAAAVLGSVLFQRASIR